MLRSWSEDKFAIHWIIRINIQISQNEVKLVKLVTEKKAFRLKILEG